MGDVRGLVVAVWVVLLSSVASPGPAASAQRAARTPRPTQGDFETAVLDRAATEVPGHDCESGDPDAPPVPPRRLDRAQRAAVRGRVIPLTGARFAAIVRTATGRDDANGDLAYALTLVVLERAGDAWRTASLTELDTDMAPFEYDEPTVVLARLEDLDDDGERELLVVLSTDTETVCGPGYCSERRTLVVDVGERACPVTLNLTTQTACQSDLVEHRTGTVLFRDVDGDGHRDAVLHSRLCPGAAESPDGDEYVTPPCERPSDALHLWRAHDDAYGN